MPDPDDVRSPPSRFELLLDFLKARLLSILLVVGVGSIVAGMIGFDVSLQRWHQLVVYTAAAFVPAGYFLGSYLTSLLYNPNHIYLVDLDATRLDGALYQFPYDDFKELTVVDEDGNDHPGYGITQLTPNLYCGKAVDLDELTVVGTWRGSLDDRELVRALGKIKELRGQLQEDAQRGFAIENSAFSIVRGAAQDEVRSIVDTFAEGSLASDGSSITENIDAALEDHGFSQDVGTIEDHTPDPDEAAADQESETDPDSNGHDPDADLETPQEVGADD